MHVWSLMSMLGVKSLYIHNGLCVVVKCYGESGVEGTIYGTVNSVTFATGISSP